MKDRWSSSQGVKYSEAGTPTTAPYRTTHDKQHHGYAWHQSLCRIIVQGCCVHVIVMFQGSICVFSSTIDCVVQASHKCTMTAINCYCVLLLHHRRLILDVIMMRDRLRECMYSSFPTATFHSLLTIDTPALVILPLFIHPLVCAVNHHT